MPAIPIFDICAMLPLLRRGASKPLKVVDLPPPPSTFKLSNDGFPSQIEGLAKKLQSRSKPSRFPLVIQCVLAERFGLVLAGGLFGIVHGLVNSCGRFMIIRAAIDAVVSRSPMAERTPIAVVLVLIMFSEMLLFIVSKHIVLDHLAHYISGRMSSLVLIKIARMGTRPHGVEETTFVSADMTQLIFNTRFTCYLPTGLAGIFGGVAVLIIYLGVSGLVGLATLVICFQANLRISRRSKNADKVVQSRLKERLRTMKQTADGIKALKFYGWEEKYCELLNELRDREVKSFTHFRRLQIFGVVLGRATPILATFTVFLAHTIQGVDLTSSEAFATVAVFQTLRVGMIFLPLSITFIFTLANTMRRSESYWNHPEPNPPSQLDSSEKMCAAVISDCEAVWDMKDECSESINEGTRLESKDPKIESSTAFRLTVPQLTVPRGSLVAIVGHVGCGKTTLVETLLGGGPHLITGRVAVENNTGLVTQDALIINGSVKENVLMGRPFDEKRFAWAIETSAMQRDLDLLPFGSDTVVGERGTTLSGGQQARVSIARAVYAQPTLLVLDDPLAAVDAAVAQHIFSNIKVFVKADDSRAALVVLNQLQLLSEFDDIIYLEHGSISARGTYQQLLDMSASFCEFAASYQRRDADSGDLDDTEATDSIVSNETTSGTQKQVAREKGDETAAPVSAKQVVEDEKTQIGAVPIEVLLKWIRNAGTHRFAGVIVLLLCAYAAFACNDLWLGRWTHDVDAGKIKKQTESFTNLAIYGCISLTHVLFSLFGCIGLVQISSIASRNLHWQCLATVMNAPLSWHEGNPSGRVLSRFASDLPIMDMQFGFALEGGLNMFLSGSLILTVICFIDIRLLAVVCVLFIPSYIKLILTVFRSVREVKRITNNAVSPVVTNTLEAVRGRLLGRVLQCSSFFISRHITFAEAFLTSSYTDLTMVQCNQLLAQCLTLSISITVSLFCLLSGSIEPALAGVALTYAFMLPYFISLLSDVTLMFFSLLPALERLFEYLPNDGNVPSEAARVLPADDIQGWPLLGAVEFRGVEMRYRDGLPLALAGLDLSIEGGEKIGIVGRTGAGKSTVMVALFRLVEPCGGSIIIDGIATKDIGLKRLRQALAMIPQEAVLIEGSAAENLDPFGEHSTSELYAVLSKVGLPPSMLEQQVGTGGESLSVGERQLLAISRVLLRKSRVVLMDEPTAHIDPDTDAKLQKVIREDFSGATLVTIAHRLHTVADFDRIVVMGAGTAMECGAPSALLTAGDGHFASMVRMLGRDAAATIMQKARSAHKANRGPSDTASALEVADCASQDTAVVPHSEPPVGAEAAWCGCTGVGV